MSTPMSEGVDLEALDRLVAEATKLAPLPWRADQPALWVKSGETALGGTAHVADIRGWGYLTGRGHALAMESDDAFGVQKLWAALVVAAVNALPVHLARIRELEAARLAPAIPAVGESEVLRAMERIKYAPGDHDAIQVIVAFARAALAPPPASGGENELREALKAGDEIVAQCLARSNDPSPKARGRQAQAHAYYGAKAAMNAVRAALAPPAHDHAQGER